MQSPYFEGKIALVTGAASGLGRAIAVEFARAGSRSLTTSPRTWGS